jgi:hypothetical protein
VGRAGVVVGVAVLAAAVAACGHSSSAGAPSRPSVESATAVAPASATGLVGMVRAACGHRVPDAIATAIPAATPTFTAHYALGSSCQWHTDDLAHRAVAVAVTTVPYSGWQRMQSALTDQTTVAGHAAVRGQQQGSCTVLVDVNGVALEVDLTGVADPGCQTTTRLAGQILAAGL